MIVHYKKIIIRFIYGGYKNPLQINMI